MRKLENLTLADIFSFRTTNEQLGHFRFAPLPWKPVKDLLISDNRRSILPHDLQTYLRDGGGEIYIGDRNPIYAVGVHARGMVDGVDTIFPRVLIGDRAGGSLLIDFDPSVNPADGNFAVSPDLIVGTVHYRGDEVTKAFQSLMPYEIGFLMLNDNWGRPEMYDLCKPIGYGRIVSRDGRLLTLGPAGTTNVSVRAVNGRWSKLLTPYFRFESNEHIGEQTMKGRVELSKVVAPVLWSYYVGEKKSWRDLLDEDSITWRRIIAHIATGSEKERYEAISGISIHPGGILDPEKTGYYCSFTSAVTRLVDYGLGLLEHGYDADKVVASLESMTRAVGRRGQLVALELEMARKYLDESLDDQAYLLKGVEGLADIWEVEHVYEQWKDLLGVADNFWELPLSENFWRELWEGLVVDKEVSEGFMSKALVSWQEYVQFLREKMNINPEDYPRIGLINHLERALLGLIYSHFAENVNVIRPDVINNVEPAWLVACDYDYELANKRRQLLRRNPAIGIDLLTIIENVVNEYGPGFNRVWEQFGNRKLYPVEVFQSLGKLDDRLLQQELMKALSYAKREDKSSNLIDVANAVRTSLHLALYLEKMGVGTSLRETLLTDWIEAFVFKQPGDFARAEFWKWWLSPMGIRSQFNSYEDFIRDCGLEDFLARPYVLPALQQVDDSRMFIRADQNNSNIWQRFMWFLVNDAFVKKMLGSYRNDFATIPTATAASLRPFIEFEQYRARTVGDESEFIESKVGHLLALLLKNYNYIIHSGKSVKPEQLEKYNQRIDMVLVRLSRYLGIKTEDL